MRHGFRGSAVQPHLRASQGDVRQHVGRADQARADRHHPAEGEGPASGRREADHARQARRPARPPPRHVAAARRRHGEEALRRARPALQGAQRRLHPRPQGRLPLRRQRPDGGDRVRRPRRRCARAGFGPDPEGRGRGAPGACVDRLPEVSEGRPPVRPFCLSADRCALDDPQPRACGLCDIRVSSDDASPGDHRVSGTPCVMRGAAIRHSRSCPSVRFLCRLC